MVKRLLQREGRFVMSGERTGTARPTVAPDLVLEVIGRNGRLLWGERFG